MLHVFDLKGDCRVERISFLAKMMLRRVRSQEAEVVGPVVGFPSPVLAEQRNIQETWRLFPFTFQVGSQAPLTAQESQLSVPTCCF